VFNLGFRDISNPTSSAVVVAVVAFWIQDMFLCMLCRNLWEAKHSSVKHTHTISNMRYVQTRFNRL